MTHAPIHISPITMLVATVISWWERRKDRDPEPEPLVPEYSDFTLVGLPVRVPGRAMRQQMVTALGDVWPGALEAAKLAGEWAWWAVRMEQEQRPAGPKHRAKVQPLRVRAGWTVRTVAA